MQGTHQLALLSSTLDEKAESQNKEAGPHITDPNSVGPGSASGHARKEKQPKTTHRLVSVTADPARSRAWKQNGFMRKCLSFHAVIESHCMLRLCISGV